MTSYIKINDMFISAKISLDPTEKFTLERSRAAKFVNDESAISWIIANMDSQYKKLNEIDIHRLTSIKIITVVDNTKSVISENDITDIAIKRRFINLYTRTYGQRTKPLFNDLVLRNTEYAKIILCKKRKLDNKDLKDLRQLLKDFLGSTKNFKIISSIYDLAIGIKNEEDAGTIRLALDDEYSCKIVTPPTLGEFKEEFEDYKNPLRILE